MLPQDNVKCVSRQFVILWAVVEKIFVYHHTFLSGGMWDSYPIYHTKQSSIGQSSWHTELSGGAPGPGRGSHQRRRYDWGCHCGWTHGRWRSIENYHWHCPPLSHDCCSIVLYVWVGYKVHKLVGGLLYHGIILQHSSFTFCCNPSWSGWVVGDTVSGSSSEGLAPFWGTSRPVFWAPSDT